MSVTAPALVVMGVSAVGKSSVGAELARLFGCEFADADDLHSPESVAKMASGHPLDDDDRWPWLDRVGHGLQLRSENGLVIACSALKREYRDRIRAACNETRFVHLDADAARLAQQAQSRRGHFMPPTLLESQIATLEPLDVDEGGVTVQVNAPPTALATRIISELSFPTLAPQASTRAPTPRA